MIKALRFETRGSQGADRWHIIGVILAAACRVRGVHQAWRKVSWASDLLSSLLLGFGVCCSPTFATEVAVVMCPGVIDNSPSSRHSSNPQLVYLALDPGFGNCLALRRWRGHVGGIVICVCAFYFALASASELGQLALLPEHSGGHFYHPRSEIALRFVGCGCGTTRQVAFISFVAAVGRVELTWDFGGWQHP